MTNRVSLKYFVTTEQARAIALRVFRDGEERWMTNINEASLRSRDLRSRIEKLLQRDQSGWQTYQEWLVYWQQESELILREILEQ